jgi:AcrR family transcriptional regulator
VSEPVPIDGRAARRDRNREAVLDAVIEMFTEGDLDPGPDAVALRVGLSARSVYRYFEDRGELLRAAIERQQQRVLPLYLIHAIGEGELGDRIERFVTARVRLYEAIAATARASRARAVVNDIMREQVEETRRLLREQVDKHFAPELAALDARGRRATSGAIDTLCQLDALDHLRVHRGFSSKETSTVLTDALEALLAPDRPNHPITPGGSRHG